MNLHPLIRSDRQTDARGDAMNMFQSSLSLIRALVPRGYSFTDLRILFLRGYFVAKQSQLYEDLLQYEKHRNQVLLSPLLHESFEKSHTYLGEYLHPFSEYCLIPERRE